VNPESRNRTKNKEQIRTHHDLRITHHALRFTHYALRITDHGSRITHYALRITIKKASCF